MVLGGRSSRSIWPTSSQWAYGCSAESADLISSSSMILPAAVSTRNIRPGWSRPLRTTVEDGTSSTPTSLASTTRPSSVTQ